MGGELGYWLSKFDDIRAKQNAAAIDDRLP